jgi:LmbE family N-acetylglucosaminyl deacetylase
MKRNLSIVGLLILLVCNSVLAADAKTLLAIFAHPDDESTVAPILARYAREGVAVTVAIATDGRYGAQDFAGIPEGDELAAVRDEEMKCAAAKLGVKLVHYDYHDQLRAAEGYDGHIPHVRALLQDIAELIAKVRPDAIITWGPDGGSNHMDHRLVGDTVTGVYLSRDWGKDISLYYYGTPASLIDDEEARSRYGVDDRYMTTVIQYEPQDFAAAADSLRCHRSQFTAATIESMISSRTKRGPAIYLRRFEPPRERSDSLFEK